MPVLPRGKRCFFTEGFIDSAQMLKENSEFYGNLSGNIWKRNLQNIQHRTSSVSVTWSGLAHRVSWVQREKMWFTTNTSNYNGFPQVPLQDLCWQKQTKRGILEMEWLPQWKCQHNILCRGSWLATVWSECWTWWAHGLIRPFWCSYILLIF